MEKDNIQEKRIEIQKAKSMNKEKPFYKQLSLLIVIFLFLIPFAAIMPFSLKSEIQTNKPCAEPNYGSLKQQQSQEGNIYEQVDCLPDTNNNLITLFILGINIDELTMWVLGVDRRLVVLKMMHEKRMIKASDIADSTDRSLQNISYAMRELEERGLVQSLTPGKKTWKRFILTEKGTEVFENLKKNHLIGK
jgi:predicted transcriptional regulator